MLSKLKNLIYNNFFPILALTLTTITFVFSLKNFYFSLLFLFLFLFFNFYYFRGPEIFVATILIPTPVLFIENTFQIPLYYFLIIWPIYYLIFIKNSNFGWLVNLALFLFIFNFLLNTFSLFFISIFFAIVLFLVMFFGFKQSLLDSILKTIFSLELFWVLFLSPIGFGYRALLNFVFLILILNKKFL